MAAAGELHVIGENFMRAKAALFNGLIISLLLAGAGSCSTARIGSGGSKGTIGVSVLTMTNPFFRVIADNLTAELQKAGYKTVVVAGEFDLPKQNQQDRDR